MKRLVLSSSVSQEEDLKMKAPSTHIGVEIGKIGVIINGLVGNVPSQLLAETLRERCLSGAYVACYEDQMLRH